MWVYHTTYRFDYTKIPNMGIVKVLDYHSVSWYALQKFQRTKIYWKSPLKFCVQSQCPLWCGPFQNKKVFISCFLYKNPNEIRLRTVKKYVQLHTSLQYFCLLEIEWQRIYEFFSVNKRKEKENIKKLKRWSKGASS